MFKSDRSAKYAVLVLMLFFFVGSIGMFIEGRLDHVLMCMGLELILLCALLNPWLLQVRYSIRMSLDFERVQRIQIGAAGMVLLFVSVLMMVV